MKPLGIVKTYEPISDISAMPTFVECVEALPAANTVPAGTIFRLINTQSGYVAMHFYCCTLIDNKKTWVDITQDPRVHYFSTGSVTLEPVYTGTGANRVLIQFLLSYSNFPTTHYSEDDETIVEDEVERDVLVGNRLSPPTCVEDGTEMFSSINPNGVTEYPVAATKIGRAEDCYYRMFRVFKSGYTMCTDAYIE